MVGARVGEIYEQERRVEERARRLREEAETFNSEMSRWMESYGALEKEVGGEGEGMGVAG